MEKNKLQGIINTLRSANLTDEERAELFAGLDIEEIKVDKDIKVDAVEACIELARANENMLDKYGDYIKEYDKLPMEVRKKICDAAHKCFLKSGVLDIEVICTFLIPDIACDEINVDPVLSAMRESAKSLKDQPNIDFSKVRMEQDPVVTAIQENNKLYEKRPRIDFTGMNYDIEKK